jgi:hypothetical protein
MIEVYDNYAAAGDWVVVKVNGKVVFANHSFSHTDMVEVLKGANIDCLYESLTDEELETK